MSAFAAAKVRLSALGAQNHEDDGREAVEQEYTNKPPQLPLDAPGMESRDVDYESESEMNTASAGLLGETAQEHGEVDSASEISTHAISHSMPNGVQTLRLEKYGSEVTLVGHYQIKVLSGIVTFLGAYLTPKSGSKTIISPNTHAVPSLSCFSAGGAVIEIASAGTADGQLSSLSRISPLFRGITDCSCEACLKKTRSSNRFAVSFWRTSIYAHDG